jgi:hypothetical protein
LSTKKENCKEIEQLINQISYLLNPDELKDLLEEIIKVYARKCPLILCKLCLIFGVKPPTSIEKSVILINKKFLKDYGVINKIDEILTEDLKSVQDEEKKDEKVQKKEIKNIPPHKIMGLSNSRMFSRQVSIVKNSSPIKKTQKMTNILPPTLKKKNKLKEFVLKTSPNKNIIDTDTVVPNTEDIN